MNFKITKVFFKKIGILLTCKTNAYFNHSNIPTFFTRLKDFIEEEGIDTFQCPVKGCDSILFDNELYDQYKFIQVRKRNYFDTEQLTPKRYEFLKANELYCPECGLRFDNVAISQQSQINQIIKKVLKLNQRITKIEERLNNA